MEEKKSIKLKPAWQSYFWYYTAGILLIPLFGAGILLLWLVHRRKNSYQYEIFDRKIRCRLNGDITELDLADINDISVRQSWIEKKFDTGTVQLKANVSIIELLGMQQPGHLADTIRQAAEAEKKRLQDLEQRKRREPEHPPGTLDKMDYLTGLWQQGLISEEDYKKEKKHFE